MKARPDLVRGWLRKAGSDEVAMEASLGAGALDAACFHAQQAAEKYLKAYLVHGGVEVPLTHNLVKLVELCTGLDPAFRDLAVTAAPLVPYAVEVRYDDDFWPTREVAEKARELSLAVKESVLNRLPQNLLGQAPGPPDHSTT